jgi:hypothetical protein
VRVFAAAESSDDPTATTEKRKRRVDTRIHWANMDEGWIGGTNKKKTEGGNSDGGKSENKEEFLGSKFADLLSQASESHYELSILILSDLLLCLLLFFYSENMVLETFFYKICDY